ncbi:MAG: TonB-dependent receptor [Gammaproteobacteria bacterium]|nr:TonB-dependent receptor [Gammaproteobacteria bacterium]
MRKLTLVAAGVASVIAGAQAMAAEQATLEEIVVTARQRAEKLEDVPATVQAFTATEIESAGIERPTDFIALTSGVSQVQTAEAGDLQVVIRGINTGRDSETNFALVIDGVLQTNPQALNQELNNIAQIEVLKGPQGALYGRNALAGAIILTTRKPGDSMEVDLGAGYGSDNTYKLNAYVSGPLGEVAKGSLSAYTRSTDGQWENAKLGCDDCVDYFEETGVSGRLLFDVAGGEIDVKGKYSKLKAGAINFNAAVALKEVADAVGYPPFNEDPNNHDFLYSNNISPINEQENINLSVKGDWDVGVGMLTAVAAYNDQTNFFLTDGTSAAFGLYAALPTCQASFAANAATFPLPPPFNYGGGNMAASFLPPYGPTTCDGYQYQQRDQEDMSLELRLTSPGDQALRWVAGVYFADISRHVIVSQGADLGQPLKAQGFVPTGGPNPTDLLYDDDFSSTVYAGFGQLAYDVAEGVEVALALRYDNEKRDVDNNVPTCTSSSSVTGGCRAQTVGFAGGSNPYINPAYSVTPSLAASGIPSRSKSYSQFQPKLSVNWKVTDEFSVFTSYGYGFRSGGFNSTGSFATVETYYGALCLGDSQFVNGGLYPATCTPSSVRGLADVNDDYKKEVSKAFEVGFKANLLDNSLSINGALFQTKVENAQFFNFFAGPFGLLRAVTNLDEVTIKGGELDFRWAAMEGLTVFGGFGYANGNIDKYTGRPYTKGNEMPYAPEYTGNLGVEYRMPLGGSGLELVSRLDSSFVGETWFHPVQENQVPNLFGLYAGFGQGEFSKMKRDPYALLNLRVGLTGEAWGVTAWGRNLTDKQYLAEIIPAPEFGGSFIHDAPGRSYGVDVTYSFK